MSQIMADQRPFFEDRATAKTVADSISPISPSPSPPLPISRPRERLIDRSSFTSVKENDCGIAQSFTDFKETPSHTTTTVNGVATGDVPTGTTAATLTVQPPAFCCPCGQFKGWKEVRLKGRGLSKSYGDLRLLGGDGSQGWEWGKSPVQLVPTIPLVPEKKKIAPAPYPAGQSPLETLPAEILDQILPLLALDLPPNGFTHRNVDLVSCLLTSRTIHAATLTTLYNRITIPHSLIFSKFLSHIAQYPSLGTVVRRLDFSHFSSVGLGRTRRMNAELQMVTAATLLRCLQLAPRLQEFLVQEHLDEDLDETVINKLFTGLPLLEALDFCGCSSTFFKENFTKVLCDPNPQLPSLPLESNIKRLSLHECTTLPSAVFDILLPRLRYITHLDLGHTAVTDSALAKIPAKARLTHLNLTRCTRISGERTVHFLTTHPAVANSLVYLNLQADISRYRLLAQPDVDLLLPLLPSTLRALNLSGAKIISSHVPLLIPLTKHLEELSLGSSELSLDDINDLFVPKSSPSTDPSGLSPEELAWTPPALHYLDLTSVAAITPGRLFSNSCVLLRPMTVPLEVIEIGEQVLSGLRERGRTPSRKLGWVVRELGRRGWYVRDTNFKSSTGDSTPASEKDSGRRAWKMGAMWWGMRKIPVGSGEVGGLYGHYMFKK